MSSLETKLKENFALFLFSDVIANLLGWFLHLEQDHQYFLPQNQNFYNL